jgi:hypothetical protein
VSTRGYGLEAVYVILTSHDVGGFPVDGLLRF